MFCLFALSGGKGLRLLFAASCAVLVIKGFGSGKGTSRPCSGSGIAGVARAGGEFVGSRLVAEVTQFEVESGDCATSLRTLSHFRSVLWFEEAPVSMSRCPASLTRTVPIWNTTVEPD